MIYNTNYFEKEFRNAYTKQRFSRNRQLSMGVFLGLVTFAVYFCLQTLSKSVLIDAVPYIMMSSYFSTLFIYLYVSLLFNVIFFIANYEYMSYVEVMRNRWYPLVQLGYGPMRLILTKLFVRILSQTYIYTVGFAMTIVVSSFFKFPFVFSYLISLYIVGLLDVLLLSVTSLAASLYFRNTVNARYVVMLIGVGIMVGKLVTGFASIVSDRARMSSLTILFDIGESIYLITAGVMIAACVVICLVRGNQLARIYNKPMLRDLPALTQQPHGTVVLRHTDPKMTQKLKSSMVEASVDDVKRRKPFSLPVFMTTLMLIVAIVSMLGMNALVLACGYASPEKETSIMGVIPYVFQSSTMEPSIKFNDLAFFRKVDLLEDVPMGEIVLFKDSAGEVQVARLKSLAEADPESDAGIRGEARYNVDIDNYVDKRYVGIAAQMIYRSQIYGVFSYADRWLGALILFASTTLGRLMLLLIPTFLVFFYDPIIKFFRNITSESEQGHMPTVSGKKQEEKAGKKEEAKK